MVLFGGHFLYQNEIYFLVPSAPADIKAVTSASSSVIVSWRTPAQPNGVIQKYTVYRREIISGKEVINFASGDISRSLYYSKTFLV